MSNLARDWRSAPHALLIVLALSGCGSNGEGATAERAPVPAFVPILPISDGLLERPDLQAIVELQLERDGPGVRARLDDPDPIVRARAALALASVQDPEGWAPLTTLLTDPDAAVRRNAAFALGQIPNSDDGAALAGALLGEADLEVRLRLIEALGKRGGREPVRTLLDGGPSAGEEVEWTLALSRAALRETRPPGLLGELISRLQDPTAQVRSAAAYYFGRASSPAGWRPEAALVRGALDAYPLDEAAAMHLLTAISRLVEPAEDAERMVRWLGGAEDWRVRANAATALLHPVWLESEPVRTALFLALDDPSEAVRVAAASSVALALWNAGLDHERGAARVLGPPEEWRVQMALLPPLVPQGYDSLAIEWTRRMAEVHPFPTVRGIELIAGNGQTEVTTLLFELADHPEPEVRGAAVAALARRWTRDGGAESEARRYLDLFVARLGDEANLPAVRAAEALAQPALLSLGGDEALRSAFEQRRSAGDPTVLLPLLGAMGPGSVPLLRGLLNDSDPRLAAGAAAALERLTGSPVPGMASAATVRLQMDWTALAARGPEPRVRIETEKGDLVLQLLPEQAPLTVQAFLAEVDRGAHDGVRFHRVVSNFVVQGGDVGLGNGSGGPGYEIRTEITLLPFRRGVIGMASAGKDTEGSQFFLMHSEQPHLDGGYTAFGWIVEGVEVLDDLQLGDRVLRIRRESEPAP